MNIHTLNTVHGNAQLFKVGTCIILIKLKLDFENKKTNFNFSLLRSTLTKYPKWGYLKQWESVLQFGSQKSKIEVSVGPCSHQGRILPFLFQGRRARWENPFPLQSQVFAGSLEHCSVFRCATRLSFPCASSHQLPSVCVCPCVIISPLLPSLVSIPILEYSLPKGSYFNLITLFKNPVSKSGHILRYWGLGIQNIFLRDTFQPTAWLDG